MRFRAKAIGLLCILCTLALPAAAGADTIDVHPGPGALQSAIDAAGAGDTLRVHDGTYTESVDVSKRLTIEDAGDGRPAIDADCGAQYAVEVNHDGVVLEGLRVVGADYSEVDFEELASGTARNLVVHDTCDAVYGINVYHSQKIKVTGNEGSGFSDTPIYIGNIDSTGNGSLVVAGNKAHDNQRGIIIEDAVRSTDLEVTDNVTNGNDVPGDSTGIYVKSSDGVLFSGNVMNGNDVYGIHLNSGSDHNRLVGNEARRNGTRNLFDEGSHNCGSQNSFQMPHC